jgi:DNA-3-methyladenine glycosylase
MAGKVLGKEYFCKPATHLAKDLLGKVLCRRVGDAVIRAKICEVECYFGEDDTACHAHRGRTARTAPMYESGGITYVYLCYGIHSMLNIVTGDAEHPEAVLIRGVDEAKGPGRVTKMLQITCDDNAIPLTEEYGIWIEDDGEKPPRCTRTPRIGIDYADRRDRERKWRFVAAPEL